MSKIAKFKKSRKNPSKAMELGETVASAFSGYAATRFIARQAYQKVVTTKPQWAKHAHVLASGIGAAATFLATKHVGKLKGWHEGAVIGAGIAVAQAAVQTYLPRYGWIVCDVMTPEQYLAPSVNATPAKQLPQLEPLQLTDSSGAAGSDVGTSLVEYEDMTFEVDDGVFDEERDFADDLKAPSMFN